MRDFNKGSRFGGGNNKGGFSKGGFNRGETRNSGGFRGAPKRDFGSRSSTEMFQATCARCHKMCEVPFRPNGKKPVFCKDCFSNERGDSPSHSFSHSNSRPTFRTPEPSHNDDLRSQINILNVKLDNLMVMIKALDRNTSVKREESLPEEVAVVKTPARKTSKRISKK